MKTGSEILAHIKQVIDMNNAELEGYFISPSRKEHIEWDNELLKSIVLWIEKPVARDHDAFGSSAMR